MLLAIGAVCLLLAAGLLALPAQMIAVWPWKLPPLLASIYAGPFLAYGVSALMLAREGRPEARRIVLVSMLAFTVLVVVASLLHLALFSFATPSAWVWFGALAASRRGDGVAPDAGAPVVMPLSSRRRARAGTRHARRARCR